MRYEIEIDSSVIPDKMRPARFGIANIGDAVLFGPLVWGHTSHSDDNKLFLILEPIPAAPEFDAGTYWRWDCHQDGLKPSIVRIATKEESATNCISPRAYEAAVIFPDGGLAFIVYRSSLTPWLPQPGERVFHRSLCIYGEVTDVGPTTTSVRWENGDFGQPPTDRLIPADFSPKPKPSPFEIDIEQIISIFATAESGLGTIAGMFGTLVERLRKVAEGQVAK